MYGGNPSLKYLNSKESVFHTHIKVDIDDRNVKPKSRLVATINNSQVK